MIHLVLARDFPLWAAWLLNHFLHTGLWFGAALLLLRLAPTLSANGRNLIWRAVLVGPLLSATVHTAAASPWRLAAWNLQTPVAATHASSASDDLEPTPRMHLTPHAPASLVDPAAPSLYPMTRALRTAAPLLVLPDPNAAPWQPKVAPVGGHAIVLSGDGAAVVKAARGSGNVAVTATPNLMLGAPHARPALTRVEAAPPLPAAPARAAAVAAAPAAAQGGGAAGWWAAAPVAPAILFALIVVALWRLGRVIDAGVRWRRDIGFRRPAADPEAHGALARLAACSGGVGDVQLTEARHLECPVAIGTREICLPARPETRLDGRLLQAVLAHELAHLERKDNLWLTVAAALEAIFFVQPLLRLVRLRMEESAELACDDRAVELTGDPIALARSLAEVASWAVLSPGPQTLAHAMAAPGRALSVRVERLLDARPPRSRLAQVMTAVALGCLAIVGLGAPSVVRPAAADDGASRWRDGAVRVPVARPVRVEARVATPPRAPVRVAAQRRLAAAPTVPNDKPGAPRLPARPSVTVTADDEVVVAPRRRGSLRVRGPRGRALVLTPDAQKALSDMVNQVKNLPGAAAFGVEIGALASDEAQKEIARDGARRELQRLREGKAPPAELRAAEQKLAEADRKVDEARKLRQERERRFERDMEAWGKGMERWGENFNRHMHAWGGNFEYSFNQRQLSDDERAERDRLRHQAAEMKRNHARLKREADRLKREAERLERRARDLEKRRGRSENDREHDEAERRAEEQAERAERMAEEQAERAERIAEQAAREAEKRAEKAEREAERRAEQLARAAEQRAEQQEREAERRAERAEREAEQRAERAEREAQTRAAAGTPAALAPLPTAVPPVPGTPSAPPPSGARPGTVSPFGSTAKPAPPPPPPPATAVRPTPATGGWAAPPAPSATPTPAPKPAPPQPAKPAPL